MDYNQYLGPKVGSHGNDRRKTLVENSETLLQIVPILAAPFPDKF
jgi:hypothetical protein